MADKKKKKNTKKKKESFVDSLIVRMFGRRPAINRNEREMLEEMGEEIK